VLHNEQLEYIADPAFAKGKIESVYTVDSVASNMHNCIYSAEDMQFDWDDEKNGANLAKHEVSFELASYVFDDPLHHSVPDLCEYEERWRTIGVAKNVMTILVVHTITEIEGEEELIRIISARLATTHERRAYEESQQGF
jgi:uncharacterized protein